MNLQRSQHFASNPHPSSESKAASAHFVPQHRTETLSMVSKSHGHNSAPNGGEESDELAADNPRGVSNICSESAVNEEAAQSGIYLRWAS